MMAKGKKTKADWMDNLIGLFSPKTKMKRLQYKFAADVIRRKYEGASIGRRTSGWRTASTSANSEISMAMTKLRDRARDLVRNNPWASRGLQVIESNVVGKGIQTQIRIKSGRNTARREEDLNRKWKAWAGTVACDYDGMHTLAGLQRLAMRSTVEGGECIVRLRKTSRKTVLGPDGEMIEVPPIALQLLEGDFLDQNKLSSEASGSNRIIQGVEINPNGQREAYHLFTDHPGSLSINLVTSSKTVRIPADEISHIYRSDRPGQIRGISWLAPIIIRLRDLDEFEDAELVRQKISSMFTAFIHDLEGIDDGLTEQEIENQLGEKMEPGLIEILPPGKDVKLAVPPSKEGYASYVNAFLHSVASGLGITYESLTGDLSQTNFSSARLGKLEMNRNIDAWQHILMLNRFMSPTFNWFLQGCELIGQKTNGARALFTPPRRELIDPTKEIPALKDAVRSGFMTLSDIVRQGGHDPESHFDEMSQDNKMIDKLGLVLDSDPRKDQSNAAGQ